VEEIAIKLAASAHATSSSIKRTPNSAAKTLAVHAGQRPSIHVSKSVDRIDDRLLPLPYPELTSYKSGLG
jgi:hypothetical protein